MRFDFDANTVEDAKKYFLHRSKQLLRFGFKIDQIISPDNGVVIAYFVKDGIPYQSIFILKDFRNKGIYKNWLHRKISDHSILGYLDKNSTHFKNKGIYKNWTTDRILTSDDCNISQYLKNNSIPYVSVNLCEFDEYKIISDFYGDKVTKRTGVELMNHIDEGLYILEKINASDIAKKAYCLHPIVQDDDSLRYNIGLLNNVSSVVMASVIEYRSVANEYLSKRELTSIDDIRLSPLEDVNQMLIADKIQNRKDFELYHIGTHPRSKELDIYFKNWLYKLGISEEFYQTIKKELF